MALINRMSRLFTADVHAVLDRIEEPDVLLKHAVREMEEELARSEQRVRTLEHEHGALGERQRKAEAMLASSASSSTSASRAATRSSRARSSSAGSRRSASSATSSSAARRSTKELAALRTTLDEQREQLDVMRQKAELLTATATGDDWRNASSPSAKPRSKSRTCASGRRGGRHERRSTECRRSARGSAPRSSRAPAAPRCSRLCAVAWAATALRAVIALLGLRLRAVHRSAAAASASAASRRSSAGSSSRAARGSSACRSGLRARAHRPRVARALAVSLLGLAAGARRSRRHALLGAAFAVWAAQRSGSAWLALWCFFLVQAFHVLIPATLTQRGSAAPPRRRRVRARASRGRSGRAALVLVDSLILVHLNNGART